jgi:hypothetical protein
VVRTCITPLGGEGEDCALAINIEVMRKERWVGMDPIPVIHCTASGLLPGGGWRQDGRVTSSPDWGTENEPISAPAKLGPF